MLGIVTRAIASYLITQGGCTAATAQTGAVTLIQRFGLARNLNIHFHMLFLDGVYCAAGPSFRRVKAPTPAEYGLPVRDPEHDFLTVEASDDSTLDELRVHSIPYRMALGLDAGRKAFTLQTLPSTGEFAHVAARASGSSLP